MTSSASSAASVARIEGVLHPVISVSDMDAALVFYRDLLGLRVISDRLDTETAAQITGYDQPEIRAMVVQCPDGSEIELAEFRRPRGRATVRGSWNDAGIIMVSLRVSSIDRVVARLSEAGVRFHSPVVQVSLPGEPSEKAVYCFGPDGTTVCLVETQASDSAESPSVNPRSQGRSAPGALATSAGLRRSSPRPSVATA